MKYIFVCLVLHYREVIAVSQDKLGKMGRRVVCTRFGYSIFDNK